MALRLKSTEASETYQALRATGTRLHHVLAREMVEETGLSFDRYAVMLMLARAADGGLRPSELADVLPMTRSGVTRLIDRLERDGVVERRSWPEDGRANLVALTPHGEMVFREAGRVHLRGIDHHVGSALTSGEMAELRRLLHKLTASLEPGEPGRPRAPGSGT